MREPHFGFGIPAAGSYTAGVRRPRGSGLFLPALLTVLVLAVAGCSTPPRAITITHFPGDTPATNNPIVTDRPAPSFVPAVETLPASVTASVPAAVPALAEVPAPLAPPATHIVSNAVPLVAVEPANLGSWIRADQWAARHSSPLPSLRAGSKQMKVLGVNCLLGFEPAWSGGALVLHPLDVSKNLDPLLETGPLWSRKSVVIDAGHGGISAGTRAITGNRFEKEFSLDWARRLRPLLESRGWKVTLTRTNDVDLSLSNRVQIAEAAGADLFLSLHFNSSFPSQAAAGLETYCLTPQGMPSNLVRQYSDDPEAHFPNNRHDSRNLRLALRIQKAVLASTGAKDRGVRRARFMDVLRGQNRPAVLIEGGYLSNPEEARKIESPEYRQKLALGVARALE